MFVSEEGKYLFVHKNFYQGTLKEKAANEDHCLQLKEDAVPRQMELSTLNLILLVKLIM